MTAMAGSPIIVTSQTSDIGIGGNNILNSVCSCSNRRCITGAVMTLNAAALMQGVDAISAAPCITIENIRA